MVVWGGEEMEYWNDLYISSESKMQYWIEFYEAHTQKIREFALKHLSLTYVEVELENDKLAEHLELYTGVKQSCVQVCHPGDDWIRKHDTTSTFNHHIICNAVNMEINSF